MHQHDTTGPGSPISKEPRTSNLEPASLSRSQAAGPKPPSLLDYLEIIVKRKRTIISMTAAATVITAIITLLIPNIYTAKTKFLPPQTGGGLLSSVMMQGALAAAIGGADILGESKSTKLYAEILKTEGLRDTIIDRFKLQQVYKKKFREDVYKVLNKKVSVQSGKEGIITVSVEDKDPKRAADMANAFVDELKKLSAGMSMTGAGNTRAFLEERIAKAREDLTQAENNVKAFQAKYKTLDAAQQAGISASAITQLTAQLTSQEIQLGVLRRTYTDSSQEVKSLQQSISVLRSKIDKLQNGGGTGILPGFEQIPERGQEYLHLMRKFKTAEAVHEMLVKQYEVAKLNSENDVSTIQIIQKALMPERKTKPKRILIVAAVTLAVFFLSVLAAFVLELCGGVPEDQRARWRGLFRIRTL